MKLSVATIVLILAVAARGQHNPHYVPGHNIMVHLFEWKWNDIADECERFLGPKGYGGVQVSPVSENAVLFHRPWWERYQPVSFKLITRSGNEEEFAGMVKRCNAAGVRIFVDVLPNHMAAEQNFTVTGTAGSICDPAANDYPAVPFTKLDFHEKCVMNDWNNRANLRNCELVGLKDIDQSQPHAAQILIDFMSKLINYGVAGFRVDAAKHMWPEDLKVIYDALPNLNTEHGFAPGSRAFIAQEVVDYGNEVISKYEYTDMGTVTEFFYSAEISRSFSHHHHVSHALSIPYWPLSPSETSLVFVDNHDNQRQEYGDLPITYKEPREYKEAVAWMVAYPFGVQRIMSSFAFVEKDDGPPKDANDNLVSPSITADGLCGNGWVCEHRWRSMWAVVEFSNVVAGTQVENSWDGYDKAAFGRGNKGFIAFNNDGNNDLNERLQTGLPGGTYCDRVTGDKSNGGCTGRTVQVGGDGYAQIFISGQDQESVLAIHVGEQSRL